MTKKILVFFLFLFSYQQSISQKTFASRSGNYKWVYTRDLMGYPEASFIDFVDSNETNIKGHIYHKIGNYYIRDSQNKVYVTDLDTSHNEYLMIDYSLNVGDTLYTNFNDKYVMKVLSKTKIKVENDSLFKIELKPLKITGTNPFVIWIESIGCIKAGVHPFFYFKNQSSNDIGYKLGCFLKNDTNLLSEFGVSCFENKFLDMGKRWHTWYSNGDTKANRIYQNSGDTIQALGNTYFSLGNNSYGRYDALEKKYYGLMHNKSKEFMIFDENAQIGDTISKYPVMARQIVRSIHYQMIDFVYRKVYTTDNETFISGIGSVKKVFWENDGAYFPEFSNGNICYHESDYINYHYPFYFQNKSNCNITSQIQNSDIEEIRFFINENELIFSYIPKVYLNTDFQIFDIQGNQIFKSKFSNHDEQIFDLSLHSGIYFIHISSNSTSYYKKLIIN